LDVFTETTKEEKMAEEIGNGGLCPVGWCFVASKADGIGDLCRSCKDYVMGSNADHHPWKCPNMCKPSLNPLVAPYCQMADLLRENIMPSKHFGDAGMFPCRVGNDLQRSQVIIILIQNMLVFSFFLSVNKTPQELFQDF
jgi:hypothetical protein